MTQFNHHSTARRKRQLRQELRRQRRALSPQQQACASRKLCQRLLHSTRFQNSKLIACYLPADGEIDPRPVISASWRAGKSVFLPVIGNGRGMRFHPYRRGDTLVRNRFGLLQPRPGRQSKPVREIDLVLLPLVGFDRSGSRLGMGGGFFDRTFRYAHNRRLRPFLLGIAHAIQELDCVPVESWDLPLDAIATDGGYFTRGSGGSRYWFGDNTRLQG